MGGRHKVCGGGLESGWVCPHMAGRWCRSFLEPLRQKNKKPNKTRVSIHTEAICQLLLFGSFEGGRSYKA